MASHCTTLIEVDYEKDTNEDNMKMTHVCQVKAKRPHNL